MARSELDLWYELWDRAGSQGLDTWYELPGRLRDEEASDVEGSGGVVGLSPKPVGGGCEGE